MELGGARACHFVELNERVGGGWKRTGMKVRADPEQAPIILTF